MKYKITSTYSCPRTHYNILRNVRSSDKMFPSYQYKTLTQHCEEEFGNTRMKCFIR